VARRKIVVKLMGGLGNQMLQYATALSLAKRLNRQLEIDIRYYEYQSSLGNTRRDVELDFFSINESKIRSWLSQPFINKLILKIPLIQNHLLSIMGISFFTDKQDLRTIADNDFSKEIYLDGYWTKYHYFNTIRDELRHLFSFDKVLVQNNSDWVKRLEYPQSVAVHVRRTDYLLPESSHYVLEREYYEKAIDEITKRMSAPRFFFFGDDHEWIQKNFNIDNDRYYLVNQNTGKNSYLDIGLMSKAHNIIISNSTFSWWSAYLKNKQGYVIAPIKWFLPGRNAYFVYDEFVPKEWIKV